MFGRAAVAVAAAIPQMANQAEAESMLAAVAAQLMVALAGQMIKVLQVAQPRGLAAAVVLVIQQTAEA
jgi:hypothetical protein